MLFLVDIHENPTQVPLPERIGVHRMGRIIADLIHEHRARSIGHVTDGFITEFDTAFIQQILDVSTQERKSDAMHNDHPNGFRIGFDLSKW